MKLGKRKCKHCGEVFQKQQPLQFVCSITCAIAYTAAQKAKNAEKARVQAAKRERAKTRALRHQLATLPELTKKAQAAFNRYIRLRDKGKPCVSCQKSLGQEPNSYDAGHYRSIGSAAHLRFDENNVHGQCKHCNCYLSGNAVLYRIGLIERLGLAAVEALETNNAPRKWSKEELREIAAKYRQKARELEADQ